MDNKEQPTGYNFEVNGKLLKEHECSICLHLIKHATELPCSDLMCRDCLEYYEAKELERNENAVFLCPLCRTVYARNQKKTVRSTDKTIRQSLEVKCKNWKQRCDWVGSISNYEDHHINVCDFVMVECPNNGCNELMERRLIEKHQETCQYRIVPCTFCEAAFPYCWLQDHQESCPSYPVQCHNLGCKELVQRKQLDDHYKNECHYQKVPCLYHELGCHVKLPRHAMTKHNHDKMQDHSFLLLKSHMELSKKNQHLEEQLKKSNNTIEQLQERVAEQEASIEKQQAEIVCLQHDAKEKENMEEKVTNLETFARQTANLLEILSDNKLSASIDFITLHQKDYEENEIVKNFKDQVMEKEVEKIECDFLKCLGNSVKNYCQVYFPDTFESRLNRLTLKMEKYYIRGFHTSYYIKTNSYPCNSVFFKYYKDEESYNQEIKKNTKWRQHSYLFASYFDLLERCFYVAFYFPIQIHTVKLLHETDEKQNKELKLNCKTLIDCNDYMINLFFVFNIRYQIHD